MRYEQWRKFMDEEGMYKRDNKERFADPDPIVNIVQLRMSRRSQQGIKKYGTTMMRDDVSTTEWIDHAIEEALDLAVYLERLKYDVRNLEKTVLENKTNTMDCIQSQ